MIPSTLLLAAAIALEAYGAVLLVRGATGLARRLGVSTLFIGITVVGFGTSTPELATSVVASWRGASEIALGNVVGSNTVNIALIVGLAALLRPLRVALRSVRREVYPVIAVALLPYVSLLTSGSMQRWTGALMLVALCVYIWSGLRRGRVESESEVEAENIQAVSSTVPRSIARVLVGLALLGVGSEVLVRSASELARLLGVSELAIGLTIVAAGTSTPEFVTSIVAAARGKTDLAMGNVLGSNVFNVLGVLGASSVVAPVPIGRQALLLDLPILAITSLALLPIVTSGSRISRGEGALLCAGYLAYLYILFEWAPVWFGSP